MIDRTPAPILQLRAQLAPLRGLWPNMEADLHRMGVATLGDLRGKQAHALADNYRNVAGHPPDPMLIPYFSALIGFAETGIATPWWQILRRNAYAEA